MLGRVWSEEPTETDHLVRMMGPSPLLSPQLERALSTQRPLLAFGGRGGASEKIN